MNDIQVTKQDNGWQVTTNSGTYTVQDKNGNGRIDSADIWTTKNGGSLPTTDEMAFAMGLSLKKENMTTEEIERYNKIQAELQKREQVQHYQQQAQVPKKKTFWQKLAGASMIAMPVMSMLTGITSLFSRSWGYNSGVFNDSMLRVFGGLTMTTAGMSAMIPLLGMFSKQQNNCFMPAANTLGTTNMTGVVESMMTAQNQWMDQQNQRMEELQKQQQARLAKQKIEQNRQFVEKVREEALAENSLYSEKNKSYLISIYDIEGEKEYSEEEIKNLEQMQKTPSIPIMHIRQDSDDKTKLSPNVAQKLQTLLTQYEQKNDMQKEDIMTEKNYERIKLILGYDTLNKDLVKELNEICEDPLDKLK